MSDDGEHKEAEDCFGSCRLSFLLTPPRLQPLLPLQLFSRHGNRNTKDESEVDPQTRWCIRRFNVEYECQSEYHYVILHFLQFIFFSFLSAMLQWLHSFFSLSLSSSSSFRLCLLLRLVLERSRKLQHYCAIRSRS